MKNIEIHMTRKEAADEVIRIINMLIDSDHEWLDIGVFFNGDIGFAHEMSGGSSFVVELYSSRDFEDFNEIEVREIIMNADFSGGIIDKETGDSSSVILVFKDEEPGITFVDRTGHKCVIKTDSALNYTAIWFGFQEVKPKILYRDALALGIKTEADCGWIEYPLPTEVMIPEKMLLTREMVNSLLPILNKFAETGNI